MDAMVCTDASLARVEGYNIVVRMVGGDCGPVVATLSGGGAGHEPAHAGYVGFGMLDCAVSGQIFSSPSVEEVLTGIRAASTNGRSVLVIVKNYTGDRYK